MACAAGTALLTTSAASAAWSPAMRLVGSGSFLDSSPPSVAFDSRGVPWVVYSNADGLVIAAVSPSGHLTDARVVAVSRSADSALLATTPGGPGILAWSFFPAGQDSDRLAPLGIAAASWRPGHGTGRRVVVAPPAASNQLDATAVNARGTAEVLWTAATAGRRTSIFATRLLRGRLAGAQELGSTPASGVAVAGLTPTSGDGFRASWQDGVLGAVSSAALPPSPPIDTAVGTSGGVFGAALSVPWPGSPYAGFAPTEQLVTNTRGDQAVVWDQTGPGAMVTVFAASRRAGRSFSAAQRLAQATWPTLLDQRVAAVIGSTGQVTVMLTQPSQYPTVASATGEIVAAGGQAGAPLSGSRLIASNEIPQREGPLLVLTPKGRSIAIWAATQPTGTGAIEAATSTNGAVFPLPQVISAPTTAQPDCQLPELLSAGGSDGALAAWTCTPRGGTGQPVNEIARFR